MGRSPVLVTLIVAVLRPVLSSISPSLMKYSPGIIRSPYRLMHGHELRPVRERRLDLHVVNHLRDSVHHLRAGKHLRAGLHQLGNRLAVARAFRIKSLIHANPSGLLSFTPRSSLRRATIAATEISSLSFSRGVRFIVVPSIGPDPRKFAAQRGHNMHEVVA